MASSATSSLVRSKDALTSELGSSSKTNQILPHTRSIRSVTQFNDISTTLGEGGTCWQGVDRLTWRSHVRLPLRTCPHSLAWNLITIYGCLNWTVLWTWEGNVDGTFGLVCLVTGGWKCVRAARDRRIWRDSNPKPCQAPVTIQYSHVALSIDLQYIRVLPWWLV